MLPPLCEAIGLTGRLVEEIPAGARGGCGGGLLAIGQWPRPRPAPGRVANQTLASPGRRAPTSCQVTEGSGSGEAEVGGPADFPTPGPNNLPPRRGACLRLSPHQRERGSSRGGGASSWGGLTCLPRCVLYVSWTRQSWWTPTCVGSMRARLARTTPGGTSSR